MHPDIFGNTSNLDLPNCNSSDSFDPKAPQTEAIVDDDIFTPQDEAESSEISETDIFDDLKGNNKITNESTFKETSDNESNESDFNRNTAPLIMPEVVSQLTTAIAEKNEKYKRMNKGTDQNDKLTANILTEQET